MQQVSQGVSDPERLKIVQCLRRGPLPVRDICKQINSPLANVSHHLKQLRVAGLVYGRKQGRFVFYALAPRLSRHPGNSPVNVLDFGCCRLELGQK